VIVLNDSPFGIRNPADRIPKNSSYVVTYAEGNRVREMTNLAGVEVLPLTRAGQKNWGLLFCSGWSGPFLLLNLAK